MKAKIYTDGGARGNPGPAGIGAWIDGPKSQEISEYIGEATNNVAEYKALIAGIKGAKKLEYDEIEIFCDSQLIVEQVKGNYKVKKEHLKGLCSEARLALNDFKTISITHIPREENKIADRLVNEAIDSKI
jgi:ribonuclease HI